MTKAVEFSPAVEVKSHIKHPDFLWYTELGSLYVECKTSEANETNFHKRVNRLTGVLDAAHMANGPWEPAHRLDVTIATTATNQVERRIRDVVALASAAFRDANRLDRPFRQGEVTGILRGRREVPPDEREIVRTSLAEVGPQPTALIYENAHATLTMSVAKHRQRTTKGLLHKARKQLPEDHPGAIFVELGGPTSVQKKVEELLALPAYERTPWIGIWTPGELRAVWRNGQPFDGRLLVARKAEAERNG